MADSILGCVIEYLGSDNETMRDLALAWLCEGYMNEPQIAQTVFTQWDNRSPEAAFSTFPMLSYFPVPAAMIGEACDRSQAMALAGSELTSLTTRCAGKLLEQTMRLSPADLAAHLTAIEETVKSHKIFFRVNVGDLKQRLALIDKPADDLAQLLNEAVAGLTRDAEDVALNKQGLQALEALRRGHPNYLDLASVIKNATGSDPSSQASLRLVLSSLSQFPSDEQLEPEIGRMLLDDRESILVTAVEALVHSGSGLAAQTLLEQFEQAGESNRRWIVRGLQRMRVHNLAPLISQLRQRVSDQTLWTMLLVAEMQQLDPASGPAIVQELNALESVSQALIDAGMLYTFVCSPLQESLEPLELEESYRGLLRRVHDKQSAATPNAPRTIKSVRRSQTRQIDKLFQKRRKI